MDFSNDRPTLVKVMDTALPIKSSQNLLPEVFLRWRTLVAWMMTWLGVWMSLGQKAEVIRVPDSPVELRFWLENMLVYHGFSMDETIMSTGLSKAEILAASTRWNMRGGSIASHTPSGNLRVLPYPGGRHPRIGFLEGAIHPQRETKISVFAPWEPGDYAVLDIPEAIWSNLGLTYLAHTHIPTVWDIRKIALEPLEWIRHGDHSLSMERTLPNGIRFATTVRSTSDHLRMRMSLMNCSKDKLSDLRVQNCVMFKGLSGFAQISNANKVFIPPYAACHDKDGRRWAITAWTPNHRIWANPPCPCMHSDPKFPDCNPGEMRVLEGWFSFYEGVDIIGEINRIRALEWDQAPMGKQEEPPSGLLVH